AGHTVDIGIRPEHVRVRTDCAATSGDETPGAITFIVEVVEPLGKEILVRAALPEGDRPANLLVPATCTLAMGDRLSVLFPAEHLYAFDPGSGMALIPTS
ncbi:MAG: TOBE domain-containing protein, partial [Coleofasciculaceae cyanobacterium SM2_3_26]|nr:TOBE domain-containing protein [Coleofasciculaceae cyanobacterium SM2_3_26]